MLHPVPSTLLRTSEHQVCVIVGQDEMIRRASTSAETRVTALVALLAYFSELEVLTLSKYTYPICPAFQLLLSNPPKSKTANSLGPFGNARGPRIRLSGYYRPVRYYYDCK